MASIVDSYSETNYDDIVQLDNTTNCPEVGQSFTGKGGTLSSSKFYLQKFGSPTGNLYVKIYDHTGTYGTSSKPTGSALATSDAVAASSISSSFELVTFTFSGGNKITLTNGTYYVVMVGYTNGDAEKYFWVGVDVSSPTHGGNKIIYSFGAGDYVASSSEDTIFYVYQDEDITTTSTTTSTSTTSTSSSTTSTSSSTTSTSSSTSSSTSISTSTTSTSSSTTSTSSSTTSTSSSTTSTSSSTTSSTSSSTSSSTTTSTTTLAAICIADQQQINETASEDITAQIPSLQYFQTFLPSISAKLCNFQVKLKRGIDIGEGTVYLKIYDTDPGTSPTIYDRPGNLLGTSDNFVKISDLTADLQVCDFNFTNGPLLTNGVKYWVTAYITISDGNPIIYASIESPNTYSRGSLYRWDGSSEPAWQDSSIYFKEYYDTTTIVTTTSTTTSTSSSTSTSTTTTSTSVPYLKFGVDESVGLKPLNSETDPLHFEVSEDEVLQLDVKLVK